MEKVTDTSIERMVSVLLRTGVLISGTVVVGGGILYLVRHASEHVNYHVFHVQPAIDSSIGHIVSGALTARSRSIIQLGLLLLIATPIVRVGLSLLGFALERDRNYVFITAIVLLVLLFSLIHGTAAG